MLTLEDFITTVYCLVDDALRDVLRGRRLRRRGFAPALTDAEVVTLEVVGEFLGLDTDEGIWTYFARHWRPWFPRLGSRTAFARQAANLWAVKQALQTAVAATLGAPADDVHVVDGVPLPVCRYGRSLGCRRFRGDAAISWCATKREWFYGFKGHLVISLRGIVTAFDATAANVDERKAADPLVTGLGGLLLGDKNYISEFWRTDLAARGLRLATPRHKGHRRGPDPRTERRIIATRRRIETVLAQLTERFHLARTWTRDRWHFTSRIARKLLAHTLAIAVNDQLGRPLLHFDGLLAAA